MSCCPFVGNLFYFALEVCLVEVQGSVPYVHWCLRPARLPIPPSGQIRSSFITRLPCKRTFRKPTKWRILSTSCGVMLSNFVKPNPHRLISGAQVTSNIPPVCSDACMAVRKGLHQVIYLTMFFVPSVSLCRIHF